MIEHLVISGGGQTGLAFYGILKAAEKQGFWKIDNIKSIYATSVGSFLAVILCLKYDWETIDTYLIHRPWHTIFKVDIYTILKSFERRGIFGVDVMEKMLEPLLAGMDISLDVTLNEFYEKTQIDLVFCVTELNELQRIKMSHSTHPDWRVVDAMYASCALPIVLEPLMRDGKCYIDGGIMCNYPVRSCLDDGREPETIFGVKKGLSHHESVSGISTLYDYLMVVMKNVMRLLNNGHETGLIENELVFEGDHVTIDGLLSMASSKEERETSIRMGEEAFAAWQRGVFPAVSGNVCSM